MTKTMGTTGFVMSGAVLFDHRSSERGALAACNEWQSLDPSYGHSDPNGGYHYHAVIHFAKQYYLGLTQHDLA